MSIFPMTDIPFADVKSWQKFASGIQPLAGADFNPAAGFVAMSALGVGMASHALAAWAGVMTGAAEASLRMFGDVEAAKPRTLRPVAPTVAPPHMVAPEPAPKVTKTVAVVPEIVPELVETPASAAVTPVVPVTKAPVEPVAKVAAEPVTKAHVDTVTKAPVEQVAKSAAEPVAKTAEPMAKATVETAAPMQPEDFRAPKPMPRPKTPDDLKAISGIGPKLETVLNSLGMWTYAQIAALRPEEVAWLDDYLSFRGRIARDDWIGQASGLGKAGRSRR